MTSRVEAVKAAIIWATERGLSPNDDRFAQAAIEANDAWLKERHEPALWAASDQIRNWSSIRDLAFHEPGLPHALARDCVGAYQEAIPLMEPEEPDQ